MAITQDKHAIWLDSPLGADVLLVERMEVSEALSRSFHANLMLVSDQGEVDPDKILGQEVTISFQPPSMGQRRFLHGYVTEFAQVGYVRRLHQYRATVKPWSWFLTRTADCRIFQGKTVPEIFEEVVKQYGFNDFELQVSSSDHKPWEYCVQYRETDFDFVSRLLEQEGIYYWFRHEDGRHVMVLADESTTAANTVSGYEAVPFIPADPSPAQRKRDHLSAWAVVRSVVSGAVATTDFDFKDPRKALAAKANVAKRHARADFELFEYPTEAPDFESAAGERVAKVRLEEQQVAEFAARGSGDAAGLAVGSRFSLEEHPRADFNREYLITGSEYCLVSNAFDAGAGGAGDEFLISIEAIDAKTRFRPARLTPKPVIQGGQTAIVVGSAGEEIYTDQYGRVKVQFHWDRYGQSDENSSCWVRVAQVWAGKNWGAMHIPRVGQEVLVSFLEGDPDRPIITGRVYNGDEMPPYELPANATQSGIKSRSTKGGSTDNFNEIRFEDKKGEEQVYIHAEKDLQTIVENDQSVEIGRDLQLSVGNNESRAVGKDRSTEVGENDSLKVGKRLVLEAGDEVLIKTGASSLVMKKDGTIQIKGVDIKISGSKSIVEKAGKEITLDTTQLTAKGVQVQVKGTQTKVEGTIVEVKAGAVLTLKGGLTKIN